MAPIALTPGPYPNGSQPSPSHSIAGDSPLTPSFDGIESLQLQKHSVLRQSVSRTSSSTHLRIGRSVAFEGQNSVHDFLSILKNERFRHMPHDGSYWDRVLKWADNIGGIVLLSHSILNDFMVNSEDATRLICDSCTSLIQLGNNHIGALLKSFSTFHKMAFTLSIFLRQSHSIRASSDVRRQLAHAFQEFARFTSDVNSYLTVRSLGLAFKPMGDFDTVISQGTSAFYNHLVSVSISMWASGKNCLHYNLHEMRDFLAPQDTVVQTLMSNQLYSESQRAEFTCDWFALRLRTFTKDRSGKNIFLVTGNACTGKTVLARWIQDRLQDSIDDDRYDVISYFVDPSVKYTIKPLSLIKSLLLQLLDRKIGREALLSRINEAMDHARNGCSSEEVEAILWSALEASLDDRRLLVLIDGLDQLSVKRVGNPHVLDTLNKITKSRRNIKVIFLSRPLSDGAKKLCQEHLALEGLPEATNDMDNFVEDFIQNSSTLRVLKDSEKSEIIRKLADKAKQSFLYAELQLDTIKQGQPASTFLKACEQAPESVEACIDLLASKIDFKRANTKRLLAWLLAAERPFTLKEVKCLLETDLDGCAYRPYAENVEDTIHQRFGSLVTTRDGLVSFRHPSIRDRLKFTAGTHKGANHSVDIKEAHKLLAMHSLAYVKIHLLQHDDLDPQRDPCDREAMEHDFKRHALFEYAARYWVEHYRSSSMYDTQSGKLGLPDQFRISFANTVRLALYEGTCLARQYIAVEAEKLQNLSFSIRKSLLGEHSAAALQSLLLELRIAKGFKDARVLSLYVYEAFKISQTICSVNVIRILAECFIEYSATLKVSKHPELRDKKIEILQYLVTVYEQEHIDQPLIVYLGYLAELYVDLEEFGEAVVLYRRLYRLRLRACGHLHEQTHSVFEVLISHLKKLELYDEVLEIILEYHEYLEQTLVITDQRRIDSTLIIVQIYEDRKEFFKAEETLIRFWRSTSRSEATLRVTELKVEFALKYTEFLYRYSRKEEAEVILRGLWTEIQTYSSEYRFEVKMIKRVEQIAQYFSKLEIFSMSRSIYQSLYEYYESREEHTSTECITIVRSLAETITKSFSSTKTIISSTKTTTTSTTVVSKEEKKTLLEIFESSLESTEITSTTIAICQALCSSYVFEERYEEACEVYMRVISKVWASIETVSVSIDITAISQHLTVELIELIISFAECHFKLLHIEIAEIVYMNIFRALICIQHIHNKDFLLAKIRLIIAFFEMTYKFHRVIEIYRELFIWMPICFGKKHRETICILMAFARICLRLRLYEEAYTACYYVYVCFHTSHRCLHFDGFEAAILLAEIYEVQCKWHLAYEVYGYLWRTFLQFGVDYKIDAWVIQKIYERYIFILEHKELVELSVLLQVSKEYHHQCLTLYTHRHEVTVRATVAYAQYCEHFEEHHELSVSLYQHVIKYCKTTKTEFSKKTLHTCNRRVAKLYSSSTKHVSKAVEIYHEEYESCKKTSITSTETLTALHSYVSTCKKQSTVESISRATQTLKSSALETFRQECSSETLIESARSIAKTYKECSFIEQARSLVVEMRGKLVEEVRISVTSSTECKHNSYVFLASFQEAISESTSFSSVMAEIREEILLYQSYFTSVKTETDYRAVIKSGCGLYFHLEHKHECRSEFVKVRKELTQYFCKYLNFNRTVRDSVLDLFFHFYIQELTKTHYEHKVVEHAVKSLFTYTSSGKFAEAYDLVLIIDRFIHLQGGFQSEYYIRVGFTLAKYLVGVGTSRCGDQKLYTAMLDLSRIILQESLRGLDKIDMELIELQQLLADLIRILSEQKKYQDLERILQALWDSRKVRNNISSSPLVLYIGRSLIQTLAALNKFSDAIHLCYHIRYNIAYIRGALDKSTLEFTELLSALYTYQKRYQDAMELHEDTLYRLSEGQSAPGLDPLRIATTHSELLKLAYKRSGETDAPNYSDLFTALDQRFSRLEQAQGWKERPSLDKWTKEGLKEGEVSIGVWKRPERFEWAFEEEETSDQRGFREELVKRRVSGRIWDWFKGEKEEKAQGGYFGKVNGKVSAKGKEVEVE
ncbi:hypothetical protein M011DRAFT_477936 [Sporormia fimetaria CBS 119925]|uniref:Nephrocystin 3-like N-terminal domain-containing protein n=1 Tax=Sporormia fimetaria CBS 119925 TaxID=1340428 RepID=A0A6A6VBU6_9PLEO|nr:hypothetical protein M011DRAFT_477936 [Sporormia fimetaria CBS 119925]